MIVAVARIAAFDQFLKTFSTKGAEKRRELGCKGAEIFRDPADPSRVSVAFDWEPQDYEGFLADPEIPPSLERSGSRNRPCTPSPSAGTPTDETTKDGHDTARRAGRSASAPRDFLASEA